jgi:hypothetical protein
MHFFDYTIIAGSRRSRRVHESTALVLAAVEVFRDLLERHGSEFRVPVPRVPEIELHWTDAGDGVAYATFYIAAGNSPVTTSGLLTGRDSQAEAQVVQSLQSLIVQLHADTPLEPSWELTEITDRPVIVSLILPSTIVAGKKAIELVGDMETCLAAAYFESLTEE